jgi:phosphoribosylformimino-5-aminoimidazole carboxamide ribotide isomerase
VWTSVARDGALAGPDIGGLRECLAAYGGPVIVSGGVSTRRDLEECARAGAAGAIVGRALYEGRLDLREALALSS